MGRTLVVVPDDSMYYFSRFKAGEVVFESLFRCDLRWALRILKVLPGLGRRLYGKWFGHVGDYSRIVVLDNAALFAPNLLEDISGRSGTRDLCLYSWNVNLPKEGIASLVVKAEKTGFSLFSYDENFCSEFGFRFNTIMYDSSVCPSRESAVSDVYFLGKVKDRADAVVRAKALFDEAGMSSDFTIVTGAGDRVDVPGVRLVEDYVSYEENLRRLCRSKAVLDVTQVGQVGYSMRVMESIFLGRKLITTNGHVEDADFFRYGNVLVLTDSTTPDDVRAFIERPFCAYGPDVRDYYSVEKWAERFAPDGIQFGVKGA